MKKVAKGVSRIIIYWGALGLGVFVVTKIMGWLDNHKTVNNYIAGTALIFLAMFIVWAIIEKSISLYKGKK